MPFCRRVTVEAELQPGSYFIYVRIDRSAIIFQNPWGEGSEAVDPKYNEPALSKYMLFDSRQLSHALNLKAKSHQVASNYRTKRSKFEPTTLESIIAKEEADRKKSALSRALSRMLASRSKVTTDPNDYYEGLLAKNPAPILGLKVYTMKDAPATLLGRLRDGIPQ